MISSHTKNITDTKLNLKTSMIRAYNYVMQIFAIDLLLPLLDA